MELKMFPNKSERTRLESEHWCEERCMDTFEFLSDLGIKNAEPVEKLYAADFEKGDQIAKNLSVRMGGPGGVSLLYHLAEHLNASCVIETGVAYGWSSLAILLSITKRNGVLYSTDMPYAKMGNDDFVGCVVPDVLRPHWKLIREADITGLPKALKKVEHIDLCHYDSDKSYLGRMWAYPLLWNKLKKGGYFISDDIGDNLAFKHFCEKLAIQPAIIKVNHQYVGVLQKKNG